MLMAVPVPIGSTRAQCRFEFFFGAAGAAAEILQQRPDTDTLLSNTYGSDLRYDTIMIRMIHDTVLSYGSIIRTV